MGPRRAPVLLALLFACNAGCIGPCSPHDPGTTPDGGSTTVTVTTTTGNGVSAVIGPAGGTVAHPSGATLVFPAGALAADTTVTIDTDTAVPRGFRWVGPVFRFGPSGAVFAKPVELSLRWDAAELGAEPPARVAAYTGPDAPDVFRAQRSTPDAASQTVTTQIGHFTRAGAGVPLSLPFKPHDLVFANGALWVVSDDASSAVPPGGALWRVDPGVSPATTKQWQTGWEDAWGVFPDPGTSTALVTARNDRWHVFGVDMSNPGGSPVDMYKAPADGVATQLHGLSRSGLPIWAGFQSCNYIYQSIAPKQEKCEPAANPPELCTETSECPLGKVCEDHATAAACEFGGACSLDTDCPPAFECNAGTCFGKNAPIMMFGDSVVRLDECQYASSPAQKFGPRFGQPCVELVDTAPAPGASGDVIATDAEQRVIYIVGNSDVTHATVLGVAGFHGTAGYQDGPSYAADMGVRALFDGPQGVAVAGDGTIYVADTHNDAIRRISPAGSLAWGDVCTVYGGPKAGTLSKPESVALDENELGLWVSDSGNQRLVYVPFLPEMTPVLSTVTPNAVMGGAADTTLTIDGAAFELDATVLADGHPLVTTYVSPTQLTAVLPSALLGQAAMLQITVRNGCPGGGSSSAVPVSVTNGVPALADVMPMEIQTGSPDVTLTLTGTGFSAMGQAFFGANALTTMVTGTTQATAVVPAALLADDAFVQVTFVNPPPGGGVSNALSVHVVSYVDAGGLPTVLATIPLQPPAIAVDGTSVYWIGGCSGLGVADGTINSVPVGGGPVTTLASGEFCPVALALSGGEVYWATIYGEVKHVPVGGGATVSVGIEQFGQPLDMGVDSFGVVLIANGGANNRTLVNFPPGSANASVMASLPGSPYRLALSGDGHAFWTSSTDSTLRLTVEWLGGSMPLASGPPGTSGGGVGITPDGATVYWVAVGAKNGAILSWDQKLGFGTVAFGQHQPSGVASDGVNVYWTLFQPGGIARVSPSGGIPTRLTTQTTWPLNLIKVDGTSVYWVDSDAGGGYRILKIDK
jgi:sugar lactone lactonase YvrE